MVFSKKREVLAMLGSSEAIESLNETKMFQSEGLTIREDNFVTAEDISAELEKKHSPFLIISEEAVTKFDKDAVKNIITAVRNIDRDILIVVLCEENVDEELLNFAYGKAVYHFYYSSDGTYDFEAIINDMLTRNIPNVTNDKEFTENEEALARRKAELESKDKEIEELREALLSSQEGEANALRLRTRISEIEAEKENISKEKIKVEEEHKKQIEKIKRQAEEEIAKAKAEAEKKVKTAMEQAKLNAQQNGNPYKPVGSITVGIFSLSRGAGASLTTCLLAERYAQMGYSVAVVEYDGSNDLSCIENGKAHYYTPEDADKRMTLMNVTTSEYDIVFIDFGNCIPLLSNGTVNVGALANKKDDIMELKRCHYKIGMAFSEVWHIEKLRYFEGNPDFASNTVFVLDDKESVDEEYLLSVIDRDIEEILQALLRMQGISDRDIKGGKKGIFRR